MLTVTLHGPEFVAAVLRCMEANKWSSKEAHDEAPFEELAFKRTLLVEAKVALADVILEELGIK